MAGARPEDHVTDATRTCAARFPSGEASLELPLLLESNSVTPALLSFKRFVVHVATVTIS